MRKLFISGLFIASQVLAQPASKPIEPVPAFEAIVVEAGTQKTEAKVGFNGKKWIKQFFRVGEIRYDVKKTDSLVDPIVGIVSFPVEMRVAGQFETKEDAEAATQPSMPGVTTYLASGTYHIRDNAWRLLEFKYTDGDRSSPLYGMQFKSSAEELRQDGSKSSLYPVLRHWVR
jgi:hypothetical protein